MCQVMMCGAISHASPNDQALYWYLFSSGFEEQFIVAYEFYTATGRHTEGGPGKNYFATPAR